MPAEKIETLIQEHDRRIPRRQAVVHPGRKGISMSIDPYDDIELYEVDQIEDKIVEMIVLRDKEPKKEEETGTEKDKEKPEEAAQPEQKNKRRLQPVRMSQIKWWFLIWSQKNVRRSM